MTLADLLLQGHETWTLGSGARQFDRLQVDMHQRWMVMVDVQRRGSIGQRFAPCTDRESVVGGQWLREP
jgi:hypothetical protein